jgi:hypothetical protein
VTLRNLPLVVSNVGHVARNRTAKLQRRARQMVLRGMKSVRKTAKRVRASMWAAVTSGRDAGRHAYTGTVRTTRYWSRVNRQMTPRLLREVSVRRELRAAARGDSPIIVGPWLSEVGYEVLYWVPFLRWFCDRYQVDPSRMVVVSRGGVASWYRDVAAHYVELLDLFDVDEFASRNAARHRAGEQKQHRLAEFDTEILRLVRNQTGLAAAAVCHPSAMFRLLHQFWLGNESLQYVQEHTRYTRVDLGPAPALPSLPERFIAVKFYTGKAIPKTEAHWHQLRALVEHLAAQSPIVALDTGLVLDEHEDFLFKGIGGVTGVSEFLTPQNNLGLQTAIIARATRFVGTCGGLAWLAPFLGVETWAVHADDELLTPHLYAARQAYRATGAAAFTSLDLRALDLTGLTRSQES